MILLHLRWLVFSALLHVGKLERITLQFQTESEERQIGSQTPHVTRLHRYDHSGKAAMLEAEEEWLLKGSSTPHHQAGYVQLSGQQTSALQMHHAAHAEIQKVGLPAETSTSAATLRGSMATQATGLSNLNSQYVGPIGVGSVIQPSGCERSLVDGGTSLVYVQHSVDSNSSASASRNACHMEDESLVWVVFDTGSTNLWVSSDLCRQGPCAHAGRSQYHHLRSVSYKKPSALVQLKIRFGTGEIRGPQAVDDLHVGPFTVKNQTFGMIEVQDGEVFEEVPFEGILGLAFPSMSAGGVTPFFDNVIEQRALGRNEFSFYFSRDVPAANAIFWGGADDAFFTGPMTYFNVTDPHYWSVDLLSFRIGSEELLGSRNVTVAGGSFLEHGLQQAPLQQRKRPKAIVDTGTTFFTAESGLFDTVMRRLPPTKCSGLSADSHPPITYTLQSSVGKEVDFSLSSEEYMVADGSGEDALCSPAFMRIDIPAAHGPAMILGEVFLRYYFSTFDRGDGKSASARVGLARASHGEEVLARLKTLTQQQPVFHGQSRV